MFWRALHFGSVLTLCLLLLGTASEFATVDNVSRVDSDSFPATAPPDTLTATVSAGTPLVRSLPDTVDGTRVTRYAVLNGPALCGTAGRSFTWITRDVSPGAHDIRLLANHPEADPDTLLFRINIDS